MEYEYEYAVIFERTGTGYSCYVPDLPGCVAAASSYAGTKRLITEAISMHLKSLRASGEPVCAPNAVATMIRISSSEP